MHPADHLSMNTQQGFRLLERYNLGVRVPLSVLRADDYLLLELPVFQPLDSDGVADADDEDPVPFHLTLVENHQVAIEEGHIGHAIPDYPDQSAVPGRRSAQHFEDDRDIGLNLGELVRLLAGSGCGGLTEEGDKGYSILIIFVRFNGDRFSSLKAE